MNTNTEQQNTSYGLPSENKKKRLEPNLTKHLIIITLGIITCCWFITQEIAKKANYNEKLNGTITKNIYYPQMGFIWYYKTKNPKTRHVLNGIIKKYISIFMLLFGIYTITTYKFSKEKKEEHKDIMGSAHLKKLKDLKKYNYIGKHSKGIILGRYIENEKQYTIRDNNPLHILNIAPTRTGKGVSNVIPNLLDCEDSVVVLDIKGENCAQTSNWRKKHLNQIVLKFDPTNEDGTTATYNPLSQIRLNTDKDIEDAQNIAEIIMGKETSSTQPYFKDAGKGLITACILHTCYEKKNQGKEATLTDVAETLTDPKLNIKEIFTKMKTTKHKNGKPHPICERQAITMLNMLKSGAGAQFQGVQGNVQTKLDIYCNPILKRNISNSSLKIKDLMNHKKPISLYICIDPKDIKRLQPLIQMIFTQIIYELTEGGVKYKKGKQKKNYKHRLLLLIDEFPAIGKIDIMNEAIAYLGGYGIRCLLIVQDLGQLKEKYGKDETITGNTAIKIIYTQAKQETAEEISKILGETTITKKSINTNISKKLFNPSSQSISTQDIKRRLLTPEEIIGLPMIRYDEETKKTIPGKEILILPGGYNVFCEQILYFQDPILSARSQLGEIKISDRVTHDQHH